MRPFFFGASLVALKKKCGGVRPIAVGCTLRRLVAKIACKRVADDMAELLALFNLAMECVGGRRLQYMLPVASFPTWKNIRLW